MAPNLEMEGKSSTVTEVSATEPNSGSASQDPENMLINCVSNVGDNTFQVGALLDGKAKVQNGSEDVEVDIIGCTKSGDNELVEAECQSTTENSSSFGATLSGTENVSTLNEVEVESPFLGDNVLTSAFDVYNGALPLRFGLILEINEFEIIIFKTSFEYVCCLGIRLRVFCSVINKSQP